MTPKKQQNDLMFAGVSRRRHAGWRHRRELAGRLVVTEAIIRAPTEDKLEAPLFFETIE